MYPRISSRIKAGRLECLTALLAATAAEVNGCDYIVPTAMREMRGYPGKVMSNDKSHEEALAKRLWTVSEELTGVVYSF